MDREFLEAIATEYQLSPEQRAAFVLRLDPAHLGESEAKLASHLNIGASTFKKRMTQVYKRLVPLCPELASVRRGKVEKLRAALQERFEQGASAREGARKAELENEEEGTVEPLNGDTAEQREPDQGIEGDGNQAVAHAENSAVIQSISNVRDVHIHVGTEAPKEPRLKLGAPMPGVRLPENFVPRPDALDAVKAKLLPEAEQTLVVSAISGLGGLGKSVLAAAIVLDPEVQARFGDGILWVTLGQNPDLQNLLGDWIRTLDKSRDSYSATTLESARSYLHNLLLERRMLLVVDDVWNAAHADWFRVGGPGCRVLVTTREAQLEGAEYFALDVMGEAEAVDLVRQKLGNRWQAEDEPEFKAFAKSLGYLPLALDLAANQVRDGLSWAELRQEFEAERREVALELLDSSECFEELDEQQQRKYSLQACFNLSLKRLKPSQLRQFAWLGVLPEDVLIEARMAQTLWRISITKAKHALMNFRRRSLLIEGADTFSGERTYRVHDLMHYTAQGLIEQGVINPIDSIQESKLPFSNIQLAHQLFLSYYQVNIGQDWWRQLADDDGYIYRHLTWHLEQAGWEIEVHNLMMATSETGHNFWFHSCDKAGGLTIFSQDIKRGWLLAERIFEHDKNSSIKLQFFYLLIAVTLNSLLDNFSVKMIDALVKHEFWSIEQAWEYISQVRDEKKVVSALQRMHSFFSDGITEMAIEKVNLFKSEKEKHNAIRFLSKSHGADFFSLLEVIRAIQDDRYREISLGFLIYTNNSDADKIIDGFNNVISEKRRARILEEILVSGKIKFSALLHMTESITDVVIKSKILSKLTKSRDSNYSELIKVVRKISPEIERLRRNRAISSQLFPLEIRRKQEEEAQIFDIESAQISVLEELADMAEARFSDFIDFVDLIESENLKSKLLIAALKTSDADSSKILSILNSFENKSTRSKVIVSIAKLGNTPYSRLLSEVDRIENDHERANAMIFISKMKDAIFEELLERAQYIDSERDQAHFLIELIDMKGAYLSRFVKYTESIQSIYLKLSVFCKLSKLDKSYALRVFDEISSIRSSRQRAQILIELSGAYSVNKNKYFELINLIQDDLVRLEIIKELKIRFEEIQEPLMLDSALSIDDEDIRLEALLHILSMKGIEDDDLINSSKDIDDEYNRAILLSELALRQPDFFTLALKEARYLDNKSERIDILERLVCLDNIDSRNWQEILVESRRIQDDCQFADLLVRLSRIDGLDLVLLQQKITKLRSSFSRARVLCAFSEVNHLFLSKALKSISFVESDSCKAWLLKKISRLPKVDLSEVFSLIASIESEYGRLEVLRELVKFQMTHWSDYSLMLGFLKTEYGKVEFFQELIRSNKGQVAQILSQAKPFLSDYAVAKLLVESSRIDRSFLSEAIEAAFGLGNNDKKENILCALEVISKERDIECSKELLGPPAISNRSNQHYESKEPFTESESDSFSHFPSSRSGFQNIMERDFVAKVSNEKNSLETWRNNLHSLAIYNRFDFMEKFHKLAPHIIEFGGQNTLNSIIDVIEDVCKQWP